MDNLGHVCLHVLPNTPLQGGDDPSDVRFGVCGALGGLGLTLTFDVVSDLVDLVKDIAVAVY